MSKKQGFTILSIILHLSCLTIFALNICTLANYALAFYIKISTSQRDTLTTHSALMLLKRDILQASNSILDWQTDPVVFKRTRLLSNGTVQSRWISWQQEEKGWRRAVGQFDIVRKKWLSRKSKLFSCALHQLKTKPLRDASQVNGVEVSYMNKKKSVVKQLISLKNRKALT
jgi:hypothetical protein